MDFSKILDFLNQPRLVFGVALITGLLLFLPISLLDQLGLTIILGSFRGYIGIAFLITIVLTLMSATSRLYIWSKEKRQQSQRARERLLLLSKLTDDERTILNGFISHHAKTQRLDVDSGVVNGLVTKDVLYRAATRATVGFADTSYYGPIYTCDYNVHDWAWDYLNNHRQLLAVQSTISGAKETRTSDPAA